MPDDSGGGSQRRQRTIRADSEDDPQKTAFVDRVLVRYRQQQDEREQMVAAKRQPGKAIRKGTD